jgi:hypothetical protein
MGNVYAFLDGDNIGIRLEELLSKNKTSEASLLSENIKIAMLEIDKILNSKPDVKIIIIGGDDVLIQYDHEKYGTDIIDEILNTFKVITGLSMSCGIGLSIGQSIINLDNAKKSGKNKIEASLYLPLVEMSKTATLYLFVDSDIPDVYVNSIVCCFERKQDFTLGKVCLVGITRDHNSDSLKKEIESIAIKVKKQFELLQTGKYLCKDFKSKQPLERDIDIEDHQKLRYAVVNNAVINNNELKVEAILYSLLGTRINQYISEGGLCIFDLSAVRKAFLLDVYTILRISNINHIFTFELKRKGRTYDDQDLIHNLSLDYNEYEYVPLNESLYTSGSVINISQADLDSRYADKVNGLIDDYSDEIARLYLFLVLLIALAILIMCVYIVFNNGWTWFEAWTFVALVPAIYVLSTLIKIIWGVDFSVDPNSLHMHFKIWKSKKIRKRINSKR